MEGHFGDIGKTVAKSTQGGLLGEAAARFSQASSEDIDGLLKMADKMRDPMKMLKDGMTQAKREFEAAKKLNQTKQIENGWGKPKVKEDL